MKRIYLSFVLFALVIISVLAQTPQAIKYQAIARDAVGNIIADQDVSLQISILEGSATGAVAYSETHIVHTNLLGLLNIEIGNGVVVSGSFSGIAWGGNIFFVKTEMDPTGGSAYVFMGTSQLLSVPYSLFSENTANVDDADADPVNELQSLSKSGTNLTLSNGGGTVSIADNDNNATNELQTISKTGSIVTLSQGGSSFTDAVKDGDFSSTNELQTLSISGNNLSLSPSGGTVNIATELPVGSSGKTLYHNGASWQASTNIFNNGGNIGIGVSNPMRKLEIYKTGDNYLRIKTNMNANVGIEFIRPGPGYYDYRILDVGGDLRFYVDGSEFFTSDGENIMTLTADGNLGIGRPDPAYRLHVVDTNATAIYAFSEDQNVHTVHAVGVRGTAIYGEHTHFGYTSPAIHGKNTGYGIGVLGDSYSPQAAVLGRALATSGVNYAIRGETSSSSGYAGYFEGGENYFEGNVGIGTINPSYPLHAIINTGTGHSIAVYGANLSTGTGQQMWGVKGEINSTNIGNPGAGVQGYSASTTGAGVGVRGESASSTGRGVFGWATNSSGVNYGVYGYTNSSNGYAGYFRGGKNYFEGYVGMGTNNPSYPLHILTTSNARALYVDNDYSGILSKYGLYSSISADGTGARYGVYSYVYANPTDASGSYGGRFYVNSNNSTGATYGVYASVSTSGTGNRWAAYFPSGNTYIGGDLRVGNTNGATGYKVSVDGKIMCEELRVELSGSWPDYVFDYNYQLMPLKELEKSIRKNKHLPGLPSASTIKENGIMVGDMTKTLTQKVEELTLYIIELDKKVEKLEKENKHLKSN